MDIKSLREEEKNITEPRRTSHENVRHKLEDIMIIALCTVVCGGQECSDMEDFGIEREQWLRSFLKLPNGIPDSGTFRRVLERINPSELSNCLGNWLEVERENRSVVAIDGKTIC